ncbi:hypothetical protein A2W24_02475 [Microgenomates group bacterium RBG_16_45_19]|nr:MAG: hypothetical protein A2W24_02475 [Microgenomates group bacterium RBG_16_45_19]
MEPIAAFMARNKLVVGLGAAGIFLMVLGLATMLQEKQKDQVVVSNQAELPQGQVRQIVVDVGGAVVKPGVYQLNEGARVAEAVALAGGLTAEADTAWISRVLNQAEVVKDGQKIYLPLAGQETSQVLGQSDEVTGGTGGGLVNVNSASLSQLDSLWGIGAVRAEAIVANRPYASLEELVSKAKLPQDVIEKNEGKISVY